MPLELEYLPADALGLSRIAMAALAGRPRPERLPAMVVPDSLASFPRPEDRFQREQRAELSTLLENHLTSYEPHVAVLDSVRAITQADTWMVIAGQQPGFLGGPLFNFYKAMHVIRLAQALSAAWDTRVIPCFWNHADDHDVAEVHHLWVQNENLDLQKISVAGLSSGRVPLSRIEFDVQKNKLAATHEQLRQNLNGGQPKPAIEPFLPRGGETFASAFTRLMLSSFGHHGLVVIEPDWIRPTLSRNLARVVASPMFERLEEGSQALRAQRLEPAIDPQTAALVFHHVEKRRHALRWNEDGFSYDDEPGSRTAAELAAEIVQDPDDFSPGALLRPIVQDLSLPVAAYIGGWGELAYHAQLPPLRAELGLPPMPFVPRLSATLVEAETRQSLEKLGLEVRQAIEGPEPEAGGDDALAGEIGLAVVDALREIARQAASDLEGLRGDLAELDRGLALQLKKAGSQVKSTVEKLASKAERVHANSLGRGRRHQRRVEHALRPRGMPQERVRGAIEIHARHGSGWVDELLRLIDPLPTEHLVVQLPAVEPGQE